mmetsp:Transcript_14376/g.16825  ORF Transcript_14376/g.16825 Transcript_14376/m.16825 type:complete len:306 (-) Transcript_14376:130-1047(-)
MRGSSLAFLRKQNLCSLGGLVGRLSSQSRRFSSKGKLSLFPTQGDTESAYSFLFLHGGWEKASSWENTAKYFSAQGHNTGTLSFSGFDNSKTRSQNETTTIHGLVEEVQEATKELGSLTVLIAPCLGGFVAQKYLESWNVAALVLINSFPPNSEALLRRIAGLNEAESFDEKSLSKYGYSGIFSSLVGKPRLTIETEKLFDTSGSNFDLNSAQAHLQAPTTALAIDIFNNPVHFEPNYVPTLVIKSEKDRIIEQEDVNEIIAFHQTEDAVEIKDASHLFILDNPAASVDLRKAIEEWFGRNFLTR